MLIEITEVRTADYVACRTEFGDAVALWRGRTPAVPGERHYIEWTVREDLVWGGNAHTSAAPGPRINMQDGQLVLRGRLSQTPHDYAVLEFGDTAIDFDVAGPVPTQAWGSWVEVSVPPACAEIYPCNY
jgi:hypothetical protein